jgi:hypothetical protein
VWALIGVAIVLAATAVLALAFMQLRKHRALLHPQLS